MQSLSKSQLLPPHVVEPVVDYVDDSPRLLFGDKANHADTDENQLLVMPLLWVCHNFHTVVHSQFCGVYHMCLYYCPRLSPKPLKTWPKCLQQITYPTHSWAKELDIDINAFAVIQGETLEKLSQSCYSGYSFPNARSLYLHICAPERWIANNSTTKTLESNITAFVERLWQMAPGIREVKIDGSYSSGSIPRYVDSYYASLVSQLYRRCNRITHMGDYNDVLSRIQVSKIHNLVHLDFHMGSHLGPSALVNDNFRCLIQLARQNTWTLQSLIVRFDEARDVSNLVGNKHGYTKYPYLRTLKLCRQIHLSSFPAPLQSSTDITKLPVFPDALPFPNLRRLYIDYDYPFGDDTFFRGNTATFEYLDIRLYPATVGVIRKHAVFMPTSHPKVQLVNIKLAQDPSALSFTSDRKQLQFLLSIASCAPIRKINGMSFGVDFTCFLPLFGDYTCIQMLSLPDARMVF
ncbi:hypothetical protein GGI17_004433 [Coemansia sp. S146]|nr:hypothetical protein GGI17_004433 [Coemansia sp. S146]